MPPAAWGFTFTNLEIALKSFLKKKKKKEKRKGGKNQNKKPGSGRSL